MSTRYIAYGLQLDASFPLLGMSPAIDAELPSLRLERVRRAELEHRWSGAAGPPSWVGKLGDGRDLRIERGERGDRLFSYGELARFHLDAEERTLACEPVDEGLDWQRALLTKVLSAISVMRGYEALHAAAVHTPWGTVAIAAPSGMGKSTLALELIVRGGALLSDDVVVLSHGPSGVLAHSGTPHMNLDGDVPLGAAAEDAVETIGTLAGERWVSVRRTSAAQAIAAVFLLERAPGLALDPEHQAQSPLPLAPYILGLGADVGRRRSRFALYGALMSGAALVRLKCALHESPGALADAIERTLQSLRDTPLAMVAS